ncbi:hypothetical protein [Aurantiacibacter poecillastricola]|uniref:hypothetical protein n=1 Tax=Aurantiacibacter poecillastricola TaxID=3064385 RepID=UPI00273FBA21|nr:hypothetical protein [Aurantiacibacter sp. 219JJ12-13]MDP5261571.1 hypothetical protein [Aurantiacibacter sp. 219JJ12-13]
MKLSKLYGWFPLICIGGAISLLATFAWYPEPAAAVFGAIALLSFSLGQMIVWQRRPCGHGKVTQRNSSGLPFFWPYVFKHCPECGTKVY